MGVKFDWELIDGLWSVESEFSTTQPQGLASMVHHGGRPSGTGQFERFRSEGRIWTLRAERQRRGDASRLFCLSDIKSP